MADFRNGRPVNPEKLNEMEEAQRCALSLSLRSERPAIPVIGEIEIPFGADLEEVAAYCAGHITISLVSKSYLCVFNPHDIQSVVVMEKPSRSQEDINRITPDSEIYAKALEQLRKKKTMALRRPLEDFAIEYSEDHKKWKIVHRHNGRPALASKREDEWSVPLPLHPDGLRRDNDMGLLQIGAGLRRGGLQAVLAALRTLSVDDQKETLRTLSIVDPSGRVHMRPLCRSATPQGMHNNVYQFLALVAYQCPGALRAGRAAVFSVPDDICFNYIRSAIFDAAMCAGRDSGEEMMLRAGFRGYLRETQKAICESMAKSGNRFFVLAPTGAGKTSVSIHKLCDLSGKIDYAFFFIDTIPGSKSIGYEIGMRCNVPVVFLDPRKTSKEKRTTPVKGAVNIVIYDHFSSYQQLEDNVISVAPQS